MNATQATLLLVDDDDVFTATLSRSLKKRGFNVHTASNSHEALAHITQMDVDLILLDPPYNEPDLAGVIQAAAALVQANGLVVLEHSRRSSAPAGSNALTSVRTLVSGDSALTFYEPQVSSEEHSVARER